MGFSKVVGGYSTSSSNQFYAIGLASNQVWYATQAAGSTSFSNWLALPLASGSSQPIVQDIDVTRDGSLQLFAVDTKGNFWVAALANGLWTWTQITTNGSSYKAIAIGKNSSSILVVAAGGGSTAAASYTSGASLTFSTISSSSAPTALAACQAPSTSGSQWLVGGMNGSSVALWVGSGSTWNTASVPSSFSPTAIALLNNGSAQIFGAALSNGAAAVSSFVSGHTSVSWSAGPVTPGNSGVSASYVQIAAAITSANNAVQVLAVDNNGLAWVAPPSGNAFGSWISLDTVDVVSFTVTCTSPTSCTYSGGLGANNQRIALTRPAVLLYTLVGPSGGNWQLGTGGLGGNGSTSAAIVFKNTHQGFLTAAPSWAVNYLSLSTTQASFCDNYDSLGWYEVLLGYTPGPQGAYATTPDPTIVNKDVTDPVGHTVEPAPPGVNRTA